MATKYSWMKTCVFFCMAVACTLTGAQVVVIVNPAYAGAAPSADQISDLFLNKSDSLPGGPVLLPVDQSESSPQRDAFYRGFVNRDAAQMKAYWARLIFTGKAKPPPVVGADAEVKLHVAKNANAIGYIAKSSVDSSVKVLLSP